MKNTLNAEYIYTYFAFCDLYQAENLWCIVQQSGSRREGGSGPSVVVKIRLVYSLQNLKLISSKEQIDIFWDYKAQRYLRPH